MTYSSALDVTSIANIEEDEATQSIVRPKNGAGLVSKSQPWRHNLEAFYHREILASGACVKYDSAIRWKSGQGNLTRDLLLALLHEFPDQLMLGMDAARSSYWTEYGRRRLPHRASRIPRQLATWSPCATSPSASTTGSALKRKPKLRPCLPGGAL